MSSTDPPPELSTAMSILTISPPDQPATNSRRCTLAPHRKHAKKFLTLPDELLTNIADNVTPEDLPNFRLTCKTLANIAAKQFGEKRLAHRRFIFTEYSLKGLVDMTAHPVFGPCIKSIMFGTDRLTNELDVLMSALQSKSTTDPATIVGVLKEYHVRWNLRSAFLRSQSLPRMLVEIFTNLSSQGTHVSLGIFNDERSDYDYRYRGLMPGYGVRREYSGLPFLRFMTLNGPTFDHIRSACTTASLRPKFFEFDLRGQEAHNGMKKDLSRLLLTNGQLQPDIDICIREGDVDILILSSLNRLEFKPRPEYDEIWGAADTSRFTLKSLGRPMRDAICAVPFTHLRMESCAMWHLEFMEILEPIAGTLQVVELVDAEFGVHYSPTEVNQILECFRDCSHLNTLVLDGLTAANKNFDVLLAKGRYWHGRQQIHGGIEVISRYDGSGWDCEASDDWSTDDKYIKDAELELQGMNYENYKDQMTYASYLEWKTEKEQELENFKNQWAEEKASRAEAMEAMARVEAREFST